MLNQRKIPLPDFQEGRHVLERLTLKEVLDKEKLADHKQALIKQRAFELDARHATEDLLRVLKCNALVYVRFPKANNITESRIGLKKFYEQVVTKVENVPEYRGVSMIAFPHDACQDRGFILLVNGYAAIYAMMKSVAEGKKDIQMLDVLVDPFTMDCCWQVKNAVILHADGLSRMLECRRKRKCWDVDLLIANRFAPFGTYGRHWYDAITRQIKEL